jgi:hypothetical protein
MIRAMTIVGLSVSHFTITPPARARVTSLHLGW